MVVTFAGLDIPQAAQLRIIFQGRFMADHQGLKGASSTFALGGRRGRSVASLVPCGSGQARLPERTATRFHHTCARNTTSQALCVHRRCRRQSARWSRARRPRCTSSSSRSLPSPRVRVHAPVHSIHGWNVRASIDSALLTGDRVNGPLSCAQAAQPRRTTKHPSAVA